MLNETDVMFAENATKQVRTTTPNTGGTTKPPAQQQSVADTDLDAFFNDLNEAEKQ